jgi:hypothetical protein
VTGLSKRFTSEHQSATFFTRRAASCICTNKKGIYTVMIGTLMTQRHKEDVGVFHARFWRCHRLLHFLACRVLGGSEWANEAVEKLLVGSISSFASLRT